MVIMKNMDRHETEDIGALLLTVAEVCRMLKISKGGVYQMVARAELPGIIKIGRRLRFRADAIKKWLTECEIKPFNTG